jgi:acyl-CoA thioester hydrolase
MGTRGGKKRLRNAMHTTRDIVTVTVHTEPFYVRDYECDLQGVVNNAVYQNYLEHARHQFLKSIGVDCVALAQSGVNLVVVRAELDYRAPLRPGDAFIVTTRMERESRLRFAFRQDIFRDSDNKLILNAKIIGAALNDRGRPFLPETLEKAFGEVAKPLGVSAGGAAGGFLPPTGER